MFKSVKEFFKPAPRVSGNIEYIIVGLGNPGRDYEMTRHNAGFLSLDYIAGQCGVKIDRLKFKSLCADTLISGKRVLLLKPQTFMNASGEAVREAAAFYKLPMEKVIIIYDDISLPIGKIRVRTKGSDGGQRGVKSIIEITSTDAFPRIKIGVGQKPSPDYDLVSWVLSKFPKADYEQLEAAIIKAYSALQLIVKGNTEEAMNNYNS